MGPEEDSAVSLQMEVSIHHMRYEHVCLPMSFNDHGIHPNIMRGECGQVFW
jgi:hypothetical protein